MDPRLEIIPHRVENVSQVIAVAGGKGGIGKSTVSATLALILAQSGYRVGLLDLDFCGPSDHVILGIKDIAPIEDKGLIPPEIHGIRFMSIVYFAKDQPSPLRGVDISNALIELFTITRWEVLDYLIIDMPPGMGDATLDVVRFIPKIRFLILTTPSKVAVETVRKLVFMLKELKIPILGIIENMKSAESPLVSSLFHEMEVSYLGAIAFDSTLERAIGDSKTLLRTDFTKDLKKIVTTHLVSNK